MFYDLLKTIFKLALNLFFNEYKVINKAEIPTQGPLIVVSNHPSTFMDPIIVASMLKTHAHFIAKGTLFNSVAKDWAMRNIMRAIPVYRRQDNPTKVQDNEAIFEQCFQLLEKNGTLIIFPEGTSINERKLRDIKTGTARIALGAEARNNFQLGVKILSIGINYSDAPSFRSDVWINVEEVIEVADYKKDYAINDRQTVRSLTDKIQTNLEKNLIIADDEQEDIFIKNIETIYKNELVSQLNLDPKLHAFTITKGIDEAVDHFEELDKDWVSQLQEKTAKYIRRLENNRLEDRFLARDRLKENSLLTDSSLSIIFLFLGGPMFVYGLIANFIPYQLTDRIAQALTKEEEYLGPIKMTAGMFIYTIFYAALVYLFQRFIAQGDWWWTIIFASSLPLTGLFTLFYNQRLKNLKTHWRLINMFYKEPKIISELFAERKAILEDLDWAKEQYLGIK